jgi:ATP-dependent helicase/DNAse subunit B
MNLILGRAGAGKTITCLQAIRSSSHDTWLVLPSTASVENLLARLQKVNESLPEGAQVLDWNGMLERFLSSGRVQMSSSRRVALCARICERTLRNDHYFGGVRSMPRFHQKLVQRFEEWGLQGLTPELLEQAAEQLPLIQELAEQCGLLIPDLQEEWTSKTREVVQLWRAYLSQLRTKNAMDAVMLYAEVVHDIPNLEPLPCKAIYLDGFRNLMEAAMQVLEMLEQRGVRLCMTLYDDPSRPELFAPTHHLIRKLGSLCQLQTTYLPAPERFQSPDLRVLEANLWHEHSANTAPPNPHPEGQETRQTSSICLLDTPSKLVEVETVARHILLLNREGVSFDEMAILLRSPESYSAMLQVVFERYSIPLQMEVDAPLSHSPLIRDLLTAIDLLTETLDMDRMMEWLHSPYVAFSKEHWHALKRQSKKIREVNAWRDWIAKLEAEGYEPEAYFLQAWLVLRTRVQSSEAGEMSLSDVSEVIATLFLSPAALKTRDSRAWQTAWQLADAFAEFAPEWPLTTQLKAVTKHWRQASYHYPVGTFGVRVMAIEEPDFGEPKVVFAMGVLEGVFPRRHPEDPFLREIERESLTGFWQQGGTGNAHASVDLTTRHETSDAERLRFYRCVTAARQRLYLSYPRTSDDSEAIASFYLEDLRSALETGGGHLSVKFYRLDEIVPREEESIHPYDLAKRNPPVEQPILPDAPNPSADPFDTPSFSLNALNKPETRAWAAHINRAFSVTELETLAKCPFHHMARYRMKVRVPRPGLHSTEIGTLLHDTLSHAYSRSQPLPTDPREIAGQLLENLDKVLAEKETEYPPWQLQIIREYCVRLLDELARREVRYQEQFQLTPRYFEWSFGEGPPDEEEQGDRPRDPASREAPIQMRAGSGKTLQVCGVVDRIDVSADQSTAMVIDYKLGEAITLNQIKECESFQMPLYGMAVKEHFGMQHVVFAYDSLSGERRYRMVPFDKQLMQQFSVQRWEGSSKQVYDIVNPNVWQEIQQKIAQQMAGLVQTLEQADILPRPGHHCNHCPFGDFCRSAHGR